MSDDETIRVRGSRPQLEALRAEIAAVSAAVPVSAAQPVQANIAKRQPLRQHELLEVVIHIAEAVIGRLIAERVKEVVARHAKEKGVKVEDSTSATPPKHDE